MYINYKNFMVTTGYGEDNSNEIVAFDKALGMAGIQNCNLVAVSSMLSENAKEIAFNKKLLKIGEVVFCVLSRATSKKGSATFAGLGVAQGVSKTRNKVKYGFVLEAHGVSRNEVQKKLKDGLIEMAKIRNFHVAEYKIHIAGSSKIKMKYGCAVTILVYR